MVILFDQFNMPNDVYEVVFATEQQVLVGKLLIQFLKEHEGEISKSEMSAFATKLHEGDYITVIDTKPYVGKKVKISYNKRQFYDRILTPMKSMGLVDYDMYRRSYKISDKFNRLMLKIGLMWLKEIDQFRPNKMF